MPKVMKKILLTIVALLALLAIVADMPGEGFLSFVAVKGFALATLCWSADKLCGMLPKEEV